MSIVPVQVEDLSSMFDSLPLNERLEVIHLGFQARRNRLNELPSDQDIPSVVFAKRFAYLSNQGFSRASLESLCTINDEDCWELKDRLNRIGELKLTATPGNPGEVNMRAMAYRLRDDANPLTLTVVAVCKNRLCVNPDHLKAKELAPDDELPMVMDFADRNPRNEAIAIEIRKYMTRYGLLLPFEKVYPIPTAYTSFPTVEELTQWYESQNRWPQEQYQNAIHAYTNELDRQPTMVMTLSELFPKDTARACIQGLLYRICLQVMKNLGHKESFIENFVYPGVTKTGDWLAKFDYELYERLMSYQDSRNILYGTDREFRLQAIHDKRWHDILKLPRWIGKIEGTLDKSGLPSGNANPNWLLDIVKEFEQQFEIEPKGSPSWPYIAAHVGVESRSRLQMNWDRAIRISPQTAPERAISDIDRIEREMIDAIRQDIPWVSPLNERWRDDKEDRRTFETIDILYRNLKKVPLMIVWPDRGLNTLTRLINLKV